MAVRRRKTRKSPARKKGLLKRHPSIRARLPKSKQARKKLGSAIMAAGRTRRADGTFINPRRKRKSTKRKAVKRTSTAIVKRVKRLETRVGAIQKKVTSHSKKLKSFGLSAMRPKSLARGKKRRR